MPSTVDGTFVKILHVFNFHTDEIAIYCLFPLHTAFINLMNHAYNIGTEAHSTKESVQRFISILGIYSRIEFGCSMKKDEEQPLMIKV